MLSRLWADFQPALIGIIEVVVAVALTQLTLYLRGKRKALGMETMRAAKDTLASDAVAYADQIARKQSAEHDLPVAPQDKLAEAISYVKRHAPERGIKAMADAEVSDALETALGYQRVLAPSPTLRTESEAG